MPLPELPLEVLSHIISLLPPSFYPPPSPSSYTLDPLPPSPQTACNLISAVSKTSPQLLEAARPWLWENVDVRSGRGWLAVVNALTEEVVEETAVAESSPTGLNHSPGSRTDIPAELAPTPDAHPQPNTLPGGMARYISAPSSSTYPYPSHGSQVVGINFTIPTYSYSPPQPPRPDLLLTPPGSGTASPIANLTSPTSTAAARLRGRSRSPRRSIGFDTEGISAVLGRSRSTSVHLARNTSADSWARRGAIGRRTSLSRTRTREEIENEADDDEEELDEEDDEVMPLSSPPLHLTSPPSHFFTPPLLEEEKFPPNPELLPPPGPYIRHLSFVNFRTIGSRRTQDEAIRGRYVTAGRLEGVIKNTPNLLTLCMTEYVDSSLSFPVLEELFFRGYRRPKRPRTLSLSRTRSLSIDPNPTNSPTTTPNQLDPPRPVYVPYETETEQDTWSRRCMFTALEALDLTGCVSEAFRDGLRQFYDTWLAEEGDELLDDGGRGRTRHRTGEKEDVDRRRRVSSRTPRFPVMKRLSLRACTTLDSPLLHSLVLSFPFLTHLDLSGTAVPSSFLSTLTESCPRTLRLTSLSLARCRRIEPSIIVDFLIHCPAAHGLVDLNLFVNITSGNPIGSNDLSRLISSAPCMKSGRLRYLDISGSDLLPTHLAVGIFPPQPSLLSLGLSYMPTLPLGPIGDFLLNLAPNVEVLTLTGTALHSSLNPTSSSLQLTLELYARLINPLTTVPFSLSSLNLSGWKNENDLRPGRTRLRVIELSSPVRRAVAEGGSGEWRVIKSKGGRGWYVDISAGWVHKDQPGGEVTFVRHLPKTHRWREWLQSLASANGRVGSAVGWHSRKMEVVKGSGMVGREEGLAGVGGFAFEE